MGYQPNYVPARRAEVLRFTKMGWTAREIAKEMGIDRRTVVRHRAAVGISQASASPLSTEERVRINEMLDDGVPIAEIARTIGRSPDTLWRRYKGRSTADAMPGSIKLRKQLGLLLDGNPNPGRCIA